MEYKAEFKKKHFFHLSYAIIGFLIVYNILKFIIVDVNDISNYLFVHFIVLLSVFGIIGLRILLIKDARILINDSDFEFIKGNKIQVKYDDIKTIKSPSWNQMYHLLIILKNEKKISIPSCFNLERIEKELNENITKR